ncbi:MAG: regulator of sigma E protease [Saprospiraceae bacterium]|jgi:regulator of sigma E protease
MDVVIMVAQLTLSLSILVILHECGHFFPARWFNTRVEKFYLFFDAGFSLLKFKRGDTEYGIGWLPLGGYVKISGMIDESFDKDQMAGPVQPWEFRSKPAWQRLIIMLGGVTVNFILAVIVFAGIFLYWGESFMLNEDATYGIAVEKFGEELGLRDGDQILEIGDYKLTEFNEYEVVRKLVIDRAEVIKVRRDNQTLSLQVHDSTIQKISQYDNREEVLFTLRLPLTVGEVAKGMEAEKIGLKAEDKIIGINGKEIRFFHEFTKEAKTLKNKKSNINVIRVADTLFMNVSFDSLGRLGFIPFGPDKFFEISKRDFTVGKALHEGLNRTVGFITDQMKAFGQIFRGKMKATESVGSFISIGKMYGGTWDWRRFWSMTAMLSALLGFINLLPIPALDGGHVMFLLWEVITGRKPSDKFLEYSTLLGFLLIICLMIFAVGIDIMRHI